MVMEKKSLSISCWNVNGYSHKGYNKFTDPEFINLICCNDIFCLMETHCELSECLNIPEFRSVHLIRTKSKKARKRYGGISIYVKKEISDGVKFLEHQTDDYIWLQLSKNFFGLQNNIYLCYMYNPPSESSYTKSLGVDYLELLEKDISKYSELGEVIIGGDLNARTSTEPDFICNDSSNHLPLYCEYSPDLPIHNRQSMDKSISSRGKQLNDLCIQSGMKILNGRTLGDSFGRYTSYQPLGSSVIDYFIVSQSLLSKVPYFQVHAFCGDLSDHCQISMSLSVNCFVHCINNNLQQFSNKYHWKEDSAVKFQTALASNDVQLCIYNFLNDNNDNKPVDILLNDFNNILYKAAELSLKKKKRSNNTKKVQRKQKHLKWYDFSLVCMKRNLYDKYKLLNRFPNNPQIRSSYFSSLKQFRKMRKCKFKSYKKDLIDKLDNLLENNPKEYWELLDQLKNLDSPSKISPNNVSGEDWLNYFKDLNSETHSDKNIESELQNLENEPIFSELDYVINVNEISKAISSLKNNKSTGFDAIGNEMLKYGQSYLLNSLQKLFNSILSSGKFPSEWCLGYISPIYKNGCKDDPSNYRGITINSCVGKLFTKLLNIRLEKFLKERGIICEEQIGFTKGKRTADHMFILKTLVDQHTKKGSKPLYTCFVDFRRAFDTVWHTGLFYKLRKYGVSNKFYYLLKDMYKQTKLCVKVNKDQVTGFFPSSVGVRQGDNMSPNLFKIFLNDFVSYVSNSKEPAKLNNLPVNCLLYADDLVLLSSSKEGLQNSINKLSSYCKKWSLEVNLKKTKCLIFNSRGTIPKLDILYEGVKLENVNKYTYLGVTMSASGSFIEARKDLYGKGLKAYFKMCKSFGEYKPKLQTFLHVFDHTVKPVLLYGSEIWGVFNPNKVKNEQSFYKFCNDFLMEKVNIKASKFILGLGRKCTTAAVMGDLGRFPIVFTVIINIIKYWKRLVNSDNILLKHALEVSQDIHDMNHVSWISCVHSILKFLDLSPNFILNKKINVKKMLLSKLIAKYKSSWETNLFNDIRKDSSQKNKLRTYRLFKNKFGYEKYLNLENFKIRNTLSKFRVGMHHLEIETGRYYNIKVEDRICKLCCQETEDEIHFLLSCEKLSHIRKPFLNKILNCSGNLSSCSNRDLFTWLFSCEDPEILLTLGLYIESLMKERENVLKNNKK